MNVTNRKFYPWLPFWTLTWKEILRFLGVPAQTVAAPVFTTLLFLFVFGMSLGSRINLPHGLSYLEFVVPGLVLSSVIQNSFANSSSSLFFSRYIGNIVDLLVTPITPPQMILAYTAAAMTRAMVVGVAVLAMCLVFTDMAWAHPLLALLIALLVSFMLAQLGLISALYSNSFESLSMYSNFLLVPLVYFGGMFYPLSVLPPFWGKLSHFNPLFYAIDAFRYSLMGFSDVSPLVSVLVTLGLSMVLFVWAALLIGRGYRLRS